MKQETDLKKIPRLRWIVTEDNSIVARTIKNPFKKDFLYFHGEEVLGIYYEADTAKKAGSRLRRYLKMLGNRVLRVQDGDRDGLILFRAGGPVPKVFLKGACRGSYSRKFEQKPSDPTQTP